MMTVEEFESLEVGDHIETVAPLPTLTKETIILQTAQVSKSKKEFVVTYCGMTLGRWVCTLTKGNLKWSM